jgi:hypothetical protein
MPINPHNLYGASSVNSEHWGTFTEVLEVQGKTAQWYDNKTKQQVTGIIDGVGFVLAPPYCGIDLDHIINPATGEIIPEAQDIISVMNSYAELSPSGTGVHIIYKGDIHTDWKKKKPINDTSELETYQTGRYFTVTGNKFNDVSTVEEREANAEAVYNCYFADSQMIEQPAPNNTSCTAVLHLNMSDSEIMGRLLRYAKPHAKSFLVVFLVMLFSIAYDIIAPILIGKIESFIKNDFEMSYLLSHVAVYAGILLISLACTYIQSIVLQKTGQKIISAIREDLFVHIESL